MRVFFLLACLAALVTAVAAWTKEDHEIFDLVSAIEASEGKGTTFYSWLGVPSTASTSEIAKAYRKKSIQLHPDKNKGLKKAHERFARLGVVSSILRNTEGRKRYDFFYKNGVPKWRGTGYYYSRFRPGLGTVFVFLVVLSSILQYFIQRLNHKRDIERVDWVIQQARSAAWGTRLVPVEGQRKVKVNLGGGPRLDGDGNLVAGRMVEMVVDGDGVYIPDADGNLDLVDKSAAVPPSLARTWFVALVAKFFRKIVRSKPPSSPGAVPSEDNESDDASATASDVPSSGATTAQEEGGARPRGARAAAVMAGGRRRKAPKKRQS
ncbi:DnaJ-domain-containing protein [Obba rivulosa]|uniref:DnaJ-domain-containing protein n=1 Tax=Obba rivulosa TaxID=1052685 RepID=A0A8E2J3Q2_9APHY|nr:DnaJ-domain-containing protein [Obba rivulosa]